MSVCLCVDLLRKSKISSSFWTAIIKDHLSVLLFICKSILKWAKIYTSMFVVDCLVKRCLNDKPLKVMKSCGLALLGNLSYNTSLIPSELKPILRNASCRYYYLWYLETYL